MICIPLHLYISFINIHFSYYSSSNFTRYTDGQITMEIASKEKVTISKDKKRNSAQKVKCASVVPGISVVVKVANKMLMCSRLFSTGFVFCVIIIMPAGPAATAAAVMVCGFKYY